MTRMPPAVSAAVDVTAGVMFRFVFAASILFLILPVLVSVLLSFDNRAFLGPFLLPVSIAIDQSKETDEHQHRRDQQHKHRRVHLPGL